MALVKCAALEPHQTHAFDFHVTCRAKRGWFFLWNILSLDHALQEYEFFPKSLSFLLSSLNIYPHELSLLNWCYLEITSSYSSGLGWCGNTHNQEWSILLEICATRVYCRQKIPTRFQFCLIFRLWLRLVLKVDCTLLSVYLITRYIKLLTGLQFFVIILNEF